mgnify:CR=1 FL=1
MVVEARADDGAGAGQQGLGVGAAAGTTWLAITLLIVACLAASAIDGAGMARVDLLLKRNTGRIFLNEINTHPGFTTISMYSKMWAASGLSYPALLDRLIALANERHTEKQESRTRVPLRAPLRNRVSGFGTRRGRCRRHHARSPDPRTRIRQVVFRCATGFGVINR